jgi:hypothetical protein
MLHKANRRRGGDGLKKLVIAENAWKRRRRMDIRKMGEGRMLMETWVLKGRRKLRQASRERVIRPA